MGYFSKEGKDDKSQDGSVFFPFDSKTIVLYSHTGGGPERTETREVEVLFDISIFKEGGIDASEGAKVWGGELCDIPMSAI